MRLRNISFYENLTISILISVMLIMLVLVLSFLLQLKKGLHKNQTADVTQILSAS